MLVSHFLEQDEIKRNGDFKPAALLPSRTLRTSVFRTDDVAEARIWEIADAEVVAKRTDRVISIHGRAEMRDSAISAAGLALDPRIPEREAHADIIGWPAEVDERLDRALAIREAGAYLRLRA